MVPAEALEEPPVGGAIALVEGFEEGVLGGGEGGLAAVAEDHAAAGAGGHRPLGRRGRAAGARRGAVGRPGVRDPVASQGGGARLQPRTNVIHHPRAICASTWRPCSSSVTPQVLDDRHRERGSQLRVVRGSS